MQIEEALTESAPVVALWWRSRRLPEVPAFAGGLLDGWPAWAVDAFGICRQEEQAVNAYLVGESRG